MSRRVQIRALHDGVMLVDADVKRIGLLAAYACVAVSVLTVVGLLVGTLLGQVEPDMWLPATVGACISALVSIALLLKLNAPSTSARRRAHPPRREADADHGRVA